MKKLKTDELNRLSIEEFKNTKKNPIVVVLDNVRSLNNVGSAFRTSDAFAVEKLYLCGITGTPPNREINKTAIGAQDSVNWEHVKETQTALETLKSEGYTIVALEQTDESKTLQDFAPTQENKYAFVFGNEVMGVDDKALALVDECIEIPQFGTKHSLNVSVTIGVALWDYLAKSI
ncbi:MAG: RNA methyltransferase [Cytophagales bacterium]|nr:RNA methyltransferase [Cytophagales bacterium]